MGRRARPPQRASRREEKSNEARIGGVVAVATLFAAGGVLAADNTVKIGVNAALTGSFVSAGNTIHNAVKLAVKQINDAGRLLVDGKTYKLEPHYRDDRTDVNTAIANARELVDDVGVKAIWGTESHDFSIAMTKITNPERCFSSPATPRSAVV